MKPLNLKTFVLFAITISALTISCKKQVFQEVECGYPSEPAPNIFLSLTDNLDRDLFLPSTPGYYDVNYIVQKNPDLVMRSNFYKEPADPYRLIFLYYKGERTFYLKLNATDIDTVYTKYEEVPQKCYSKFLLKSFKYNGKEMADSVKHRYFTIKK